MSTILDLPEVRERVFRWSVKDYEQMADTPSFRHTELIRGLIVNKMSKSPLHSTLATRLYLLLVRMVCAGFVPRKEEPLRLADSMPEPDISVMRGAVGDFAEQHPSTAELVVEVAVSSLAPDRENTALYAEAGVKEYWIVLGEAEQVEVYRLLADGTYRERRTYGRGESIPGVDVIGGDFVVDELFA